MKKTTESTDLSIIIVSYNTADLIVSCLSSLEVNQDIRKDIFVVDNASQDGSADIVRRLFPNVHLIKNMVNMGFSAANNQALETCRGDFILFLNPDTRIKADTLEKAVTFMKKNPAVGLAGGRILNPDGTIQESISGRYPSENYTRGDLPNSLPGKIPCVLGAAMIARREVVEQVRGFDEDYFLYGEDEDLCLRIRKAGWEIGYIEEAEVIHLGGQSERLTLTAEKWRKKIPAEYLFYKKHYRLETIKKIRRADRLKARWRLLTLAVGMPFQKDRSGSLEKQDRYRVLLEETDKINI
ncbi:MAG: glycosyltransferase family 2 protein [Syntrophales bacterium]|nr:glycosyltransferase family 2 protein [Syntrophales bacterium]